MSISISNQHYQSTSAKKTTPTVNENTGFKRKWAKEAGRHINAWQLAKLDKSPTEMQKSSELLDQHLMSGKNEPEFEKVMNELKDIGYRSTVGHEHKLDHSV